MEAWNLYKTQVDILRKTQDTNKRKSWLTSICQSYNYCTEVISHNKDKNGATLTDIFIFKIQDID